MYCLDFKYSLPPHSRLLLQFLDPLQTSLSLLLARARVVDRGRDQVHHAPVVAVRVALGRLLAAVLPVGRVVLLAQRLDAQPPELLFTL